MKNLRSTKEYLQILEILEKHSSFIIDENNCKQRVNFTWRWGNIANEICNKLEENKSHKSNHMNSSKNSTLEINSEYVSFPEYFTPKDIERYEHHLRNPSKLWYGLKSEFSSKKSFMFAWVNIRQPLWNEIKENAVITLGKNASRPYIVKYINLSEDVMQLSDGKNVYGMRPISNTPYVKIKGKNPNDADIQKNSGELPF